MTSQRIPSSSKRVTRPLRLSTADVVCSATLGEYGLELFDTGAIDATTEVVSEEGGDVLQARRVHGASLLLILERERKMPVHTHGEHALTEDVATQQHLVGAGAVCLILQHLDALMQHSGSTDG